MENNIKTDYYRRLTVLRDNRRFIDQYLQGSGCELEEKFWSPNSSSRLAFDLYSWIPNVEFEKKLPGVICSPSGPAGVPNIDVFIEMEDRLLFIESKYTEAASLSYTLGNKPNLSKAYWYKGYHGKLPIERRFYGNGMVAERFSNFCIEIQNVIGSDPRKENKWKWFDVKQETCHLFGIIFYALQAHKEGKTFICSSSNQIKKKISLLNIIWRLTDDNFDCPDDSLPRIFEKKANSMVNEILGDCFEFKVYCVQDLLNSNNFYGLDFLHAKSFEKENLVIEQMLQYKRSDKR